MSNSTLGFQNPTTTNKSLDTEQLNVGGTMVERERVQITGDRSDAITQVLNSTAAPTMWGPVVHSLQDTRLDSLNDGVNTLATAPAYTGDFTFSGGPGVILELKGSSTKTIQVLEIYYTKPSAQAELTISKRSAAASGGASATPTKVPHSSANAAASATLTTYTSVPTPGTLTGQIFNDIVGTSDRISLKWGDNNVQPPTLSGTSQALTLEAGVAAFHRGHIKWTEL